MNTYDTTAPITWSHSARAHSREAGYSKGYLEAVFRNPEHVHEQGRARWISTGYGFGLVIAKHKGRGYIIVAVFKDRGEAAYPAAV